MKRKFTEEQIAFALKQAEMGTPVVEVIRKMEIIEQAYYCWKKKYGGLGLSEVCRLKQLEEENRKLKQMVADQSLDKHMLQEVLSKKVMRPAGRRALVRYLEGSFRVGERRTCAVVGIRRSTHQYRSIAPVQTALWMRIREIAAVRVRYGYKHIHVLLRREGSAVNPKRVYRLYCEQELNLHRKQKRKRARGNLRLVRQQPLQLNEYWSMDFAADALFNGRRFRVLSVVNIFSRKCLGIEVDQGIRGRDAVELLDRIKAARGIPGSLRCDNGPEFVSKVLDLWAYENRVSLDFSRPGKPTDNAFAESFIGSLRDECLNVSWFMPLEDAREKIEAWRTDYNEYRPHSSPGYKAPGDYFKMGILEAGRLTA